jgi:hypothetical protein
VTGVYRVLKPHLAAVYARHLADANGIYEPPTRRILQRCLDEERRHVAAGALVVGRLGADPEWRRRADEWEQRLLAALGAAGGITGAAGIERDFAAPSSGPEETSPWHPARDVVALGSVFSPDAVPPDLAACLEAHGRALLTGDRAALERDVVPGAWAAVDATYVDLRGPWDRARVVACARIGAYRVVKLALEGVAGRTTLQLRWRPVDGAWRLSAADVVPSFRDNWPPWAVKVQWPDVPLGPRRQSRRDRAPYLPGVPAARRQDDRGSFGGRSRRAARP